MKSQIGLAGSARLLTKSDQAAIPLIVRLPDIRIRLRKTDVREHAVDELARHLG
jgi:hypothetical protein